MNATGGSLPIGDRMLCADMLSLINIVPPSNDSEVVLIDWPTASQAHIEAALPSNA